LKRQLSSAEDSYPRGVGRPLSEESHPIAPLNALRYRERDPRGHGRGYDPAGGGERWLAHRGRIRRGPSARRAGRPAPGTPSWSPRLTRARSPSRWRGTSACCARRHRTRGRQNGRALLPCSARGPRSARIRAPGAFSARGRGHGAPGRSRGRRRGGGPGHARPTYTATVVPLGLPSTGGLGGVLARGPLLPAEGARGG